MIFSEDNGTRKCFVGDYRRAGYSAFLLVDDLILSLMPTCPSQQAGSAGLDQWPRSEVSTAKSSYLSWTRLIRSRAVAWMVAAVSFVDFLRRSERPVIFSHPIPC